MKHLKILKHTHHLNPGEIAGFSDSDADALVKSGHGEIVEIPDEKKAEQKKPAEKGEGK